MLKEVLIRNYTDYQDMESFLAYIIVDENSNFDGVLEVGDGYLISGSLADGMEMTCYTPSDQLDKIYIGTEDGNCYEGYVYATSDDQRVLLSKFSATIYESNKELESYINDMVAFLKGQKSNKVITKTSSHN